MKISPKRLHETLKNKGVSSIYHAASVIASCHFLRNRCLLSHGTLNKIGLHNTSQISNHIEKDHGIWNDIFTNPIDTHAQDKVANVHGPVLFELDIEIIKNSYTGKVWVTKSNPIEWELHRNHEKRWFASANDLENNFSRHNSNHMTVFRHCGGMLPIHNHLNKIIIDDPKLKTDTYQIDFFSMAYGAIKLAMTEGDIKAPIEKRECDADCSCFKNYKNSMIETEKLFSPYFQ